ncbi:MAG: hypothetical protein ABH823_00360 [bacterium]
MGAFVALTRLIHRNLGGGLDRLAKKVPIYTGETRHVLVISSSTFSDHERFDSAVHLAALGTKPAVVETFLETDWAKIHLSGRIILLRALETSPEPAIAKLAQTQVEQTEDLAERLVLNAARMSVMENGAPAIADLARENADLFQELASEPLDRYPILDVTIRQIHSIKSIELVLACLARSIGVSEERFRFLLISFFLHHRELRNALKLLENIADIETQKAARLTVAKYLMAQALREIEEGAFLGSDVSLSAAAHHLSYCDEDVRVRESGSFRMSLAGLERNNLAAQFGQDLARNVALRGKGL